MHEELIKQARDKAGNYFKEGYNCAEAVFLAFRDFLAPEMDPGMVKLVTGFGGGIGHGGCVCGALSGSIIALNMLKGRTSKEGDREVIYQLSKEFIIFCILDDIAIACGNFWIKTQSGIIVKKQRLVKNKPASAKAASYWPGGGWPLPKTDCFYP